MKKVLEKKAILVPPPYEISTVTTTGVFAVRSVAAASSSASVALVWSLPADTSSYGGVIVEWDGGSSGNLDADKTSYTVKGLSESIKYTFKITTLDKNNIKTSSYAEISITTPAAQKVLSSSENENPGPVTEVPETDTTAPAKVASLNALTGPETVVLTWEDPSDADLFAIKIYKPAASSSARNAVTLEDGILINKGVKTYTFKNLTAGAEYTFKVSAVDTSLNESDVESVKAVPAGKDSESDTTAPADVTELAADYADGTVSLSWKNPSDSDFWGIKITASPADGTFKNPVYIIGPEEFVGAGLSDDTEYEFTLVALDKSLNESSGAKISVNKATQAAEPKAFDKIVTIGSKVSFGDVVRASDGKDYAVVSAYLNGSLISYNSSAAVANSLSSEINEKLQNFSKDAAFVKSFLEEGKINEYVQLYNVTDTAAGEEDIFRIVNPEGKYVARYRQVFELEKVRYEIVVYTSDSLKKTKRRRYNYVNNKIDFSDDSLDQVSIQKDYHQLGDSLNSSYIWKSAFSDGKTRKVEYVIKSVMDSEQYNIGTSSEDRGGGILFIARGTGRNDASSASRRNELFISGGTGRLSITAQLYSENTAATLGQSKVKATGESTKYIRVGINFDETIKNLLDQKAVVYDGATYAEKNGRYITTAGAPVSEDLTFRQAISKYLKDYIRISEKTKEISLDETTYVAPVLYARANFNSGYTEFYNSDFLDVKLYPYVTEYGRFAYRVDDIPYAEMENVTMWSENDRVPEFVQKYSSAFDSVYNGTYKAKTSIFN